VSLVGFMRTGLDFLFMLVLAPEIPTLLIQTRAIFPRAFASTCDTLYPFERTLGF
jgi:hypothetical protein